MFRTRVAGLDPRRDPARLFRRRFPSSDPLAAFGLPTWRRSIHSYAESNECLLAANRTPGKPPRPFPHPTMMGGPHQRGLHLVALFEAAKGAIVMFVGFGLLSLIHQDVELVADALPNSCTSTR